MLTEYISSVMLFSLAMVMPVKSEKVVMQRQVRAAITFHHGVQGQLDSDHLVSAVLQIGSPGSWDEL